MTVTASISVKTRQHLATNTRLTQEICYRCLLRFLFWPWAEKFAPEARLPSHSLASFSPHDFEEVVKNLAGLRFLGLKAVLVFDQLLEAVFTYLIK